jgi:hypothetical protein
MKPSGVVLVFFAVALTFSSCATPQKRAALKELRAELANYTDVLRHSEIDLYGDGYSWLGPPDRYLCLSLYLRPEYSNSETVIAVRDRLLTYLNNWNIELDVFTMYFYTKKGKESVLLYNVGYRRDATGQWLFWFEGGDIIDTDP